MVLGLGKIAKILEKSKNVRTLIMALIRMDNIFILIGRSKKYKKSGCTQRPSHLYKGKKF